MSGTALDTAGPDGVEKPVEETVLVAVDEGVGWIRLNRPERLNAMTYPMMGRVCEVLEELAADESVRAVVLTGVGRAFCSGADTGGMAGRTRMDPEARRARIEDYGRATLILHTMAKPTVAAINGAAVGAGLALALACDLRWAADGAKLIGGYGAIGTSGDFGISWSTTRHMGPSRALRFLLLDERLDARQALDAGLVDEVVPAGELEATAGALARRLASGPTRAYARMKANIAIAAGADLATMLREESGRMIECLMTADHAEGVAAFREKRAPRFTGA